MQRNACLVVLTVTGSALCWWPAMVEPSIHFPRWMLLVLVALISGLSASLSDGRWLRVVGACAVGAFAGLCCGCVLFPSSDGIADSYAPIVAAVATLATALVSFVAGLVGRMLAVSKQIYRRAVWVALACCVAFGPVALAVTPPLVAHRVARNDGIAAERFAALDSAVELTWAEAGGPESICDGSALKRHYEGPPFSDEDWRRIAGNYVTEDGYSFMVYCQARNGYRIHAVPWRGKEEGTLEFCTDGSGGIGCGMTSNDSNCIYCVK